jgi:hypothetical protein
MISDYGYVRSTGKDGERKQLCPFLHYPELTYTDWWQADRYTDRQGEPHRHISATFSCRTGLKIKPLSELGPSYSHKFSYKFFQNYRNLFDVYSPSITQALTGKKHSKQFFWNVAEGRWDMRIKFWSERQKGRDPLWRPKCWWSYGLN